MHERSGRAPGGTAGVSHSGERLNRVNVDKMLVILMHRGQHGGNYYVQYEESRMEFRFMPIHVKKKKNSIRKGKGKPTNKNGDYCLQHPPLLFRWFGVGS